MIRSINERCVDMLIAQVTVSKGLCTGPKRIKNWRWSQHVVGNHQAAKVNVVLLYGQSILVQHYNEARAVLAGSWSSAGFNRPPAPPRNRDWAPMVKREDRSGRPFARFAKFLLPPGDRTLTGCRHAGECLARPLQSFNCG